MSQSSCYSLRSLGKAPSLSAITHASNPRSFEDGIFLPSSCHSRTWLLDNFQESCSETTTHQMTNCEQDPVMGDACMQSSCLPRVVRTTSSSAKPCERKSCQSGNSPVMYESASQSCQSRNSQQRGFVTHCHQSSSYMATCCPQTTPGSQSCQTVEYETSQCQCHIHDSSSCSPVGHAASEPQLLEASSTYEPTCCVIGGLQSPSK